MVYIDSFHFPGVEAEEQFVNYIRRTCYTSFYPFGVLAAHRLSELCFSEITILYGNNGSGKSRNEPGGKTGRNPGDHQ